MHRKSFLAKITGIKKEDKKKEENQEMDTTLDKIEEETAKNKKAEPYAKNSKKNKADEKSENWAQENYEGQLSVDVFQTKDEIVIKSAVAGVNPNDLDLSISNDMITIRGSRHQAEEVVAEDYFYQECYWGSFSRSIILPQEVRADAAKADFKKGILTIRLPKAQQEKKIKIKISDND